MAERLFINASWKRWIAENLLRGAPAANLTQILSDHGFDPQLAQLEVDAAQAHPYLEAAAAVNRQLQKRDWVLHNSRLLRDAHVGPIDEFHGDIDPETFFQDYYALCRPLVLREGAKALPALSRWTPEFLKQTIGSREVEIQAGRNSDPRYEINLEHRSQ